MSEKDRASLVSAISGIIGSTCGKAFSHPIDTVKARLQVTSGATLNKGQGSVILNVANDVIKSEGVRGLYRGLPTALIGGIPGAFMYFGAYEFWKNHTLKIEYFKNHSFISYLTAGIFAETCACMVFVPTDVLKERLQVQTKLKMYEYKGDLNALVQVLKTEGFRGIYKAYPATVFSFGPFSALYFTFYEKLKGLFVDNEASTYLSKVKEKSHVQIGFFQSMFWSMIAGAGASFITNPLDMVKLRLQVQRGTKASSGMDANPFVYKHMLDGLIQITKNEGPLALWNGSIARVWTHFPTVAIAMSVIEATKPYVEKALGE
jgi:hypothetical protein